MPSAEETALLSRIDEMGELLGQLVGEVGQLELHDSKWLEDGTTDLQIGLYKLKKHILNQSTFV